MGRRLLTLPHRCWERLFEGVGKRARGCESFGGFRSERTCKSRPQGFQIRARQVRQRLGGFSSDGRQAPSPEHLVHKGRQAEDVRAPIPRGARDALGSGIWAPHRRGHADRLERLADAQSGQSSLISRNQNVPRVKGAVTNTAPGREVDRVGQFGRDPHRVVGRHGPAIADQHIERIGGGILPNQVDRDPIGPARERSGNAPMRHSRSNQALELADELVHSLRREVEPKQFDGNETFAIGVERAEDGSERTGADLMENPEWSERVRRRGAGSFRVQ